jgi:SAM-dependent methyltransferase
MSTPAATTHATTSAAAPGTPRRLDLGCGKARAVPGAVTVDISPDANPDIVHDLDVVPWPLPSDTFDEVHMVHVVEHLDNIVKAMEEVHRVARNGARVRIVTPHYSSTNSFTDPTHRHHLGLRSFNYFTGEHHFDFYTRCRFRTISKELKFNDWPFAWLMRFIARKWPLYYEERLCWLHPALEMEIELEVVKPATQA